MLPFTVMVLTMFLFLYPVGVEGDSNSLCFDSTSSIAQRAAVSNPLAVETCRLNSDCFYGECTQERCTIPALTCQTNVAGKTYTPVYHRSEALLFLVSVT